jgi:transposase
MLLRLQGNSARRAAVAVRLGSQPNRNTRRASCAREVGGAGMRHRQGVLDANWPKVPKSLTSPNAEPLVDPIRPPKPDDRRARAFFEPRDWLGLETLHPLQIERIYGVDTGPELPEAVGFKRELMGWTPEVPLVEIRVECLPRVWLEEHREYVHFHSDEREPEGARWPYKPCCANRRLVRYAKRPVTVQDRRIHNVPVFLDIARQRFRCNNCGKYCAEDLPDVYEQHRITRRLHRDIAMGSVVRPFAEVADLQSVSEELVQKVFDRYQKLMLTGYAVNLPKVIGIDEVNIRGTTCFVISDMTNNRILDMVPGVSKVSVFAAFGQHFFHNNVDVICQDMSLTYRKAMKKLFPDADIVIDRFHVVKLATDALDQARIAVGAAALSKEDQTRLSRLGRLFNRNSRKLTPEQRDILDFEKTYFPKLGQAHELKEDFARIYTRTTRPEAEKAYAAWLLKLDDPEFALAAPHFRGIDATVAKWRAEIFNFFDAPRQNGFEKRVTNGFVEGLNRSIRAINRDANGLSFETLRAKAILRFGHFQRVNEIMAFRFPPQFLPDEIELEDQKPLWRGFDLQTLAASIKGGAF